MHEPTRSDALRDAVRNFVTSLWCRSSPIRAFSRALLLRDPAERLGARGARHLTVRADASLTFSWMTYH